MKKYVHENYIEQEEQRSRVYYYLDKYMSDHIYEIEELPKYNQSVIEGKTIWMLWWQGQENMPALVKKCYESVLRNCPEDFSVILLSESLLEEYIRLPDYIMQKYQEGKISIAHLSDLIRLELLCTYGGAWIDATVFCCGKIPRYMLETELFFFHGSRMDIPVIKLSNWWIAAQKHDRLLQATRKVLHHYWMAEDSAIDYFFFHIIVSKIIDEDKASDKLFRDMPYFNNSNAHVLVSMLYEEFTWERWEMIKKASPVQKLTYKPYLEQKGKYTFYDAILNDAIKECKYLAGDIRNTCAKYKFSVIIPVYNVEKYLCRCLDSVFQQTFLDYEVICIGDVSTDHSLEILESYALDHPMKILVNDKIGGLSYARNRGLDAAGGEYVLFLDSDDYISENLLERLNEELQKENYDFLTFSSKMFYDSDVKYTLIYEPTRKNQYPEVYGGKELYLLQSRQGDYKPTVWQYCYNKQFLEENDLRFVVGRNSEDEMFTFHVFMKARRIKVLPDILHYYRVRNGALTGPEKIIERLLDSIDNYIEYICFYIQSHGTDMDLEECARLQVERGAAGILDNYRKIPYEKYIRFDQFMRNDLQRLFMREILSRQKRKIFCKEAEEQLGVHKKIYVYGAGKYAERVIRVLKNENIRLEGILVSNAKDNPEEYCDYKVYEYDKVKGKLSGALIIVGASEKNSAEILNSLTGSENVGILECKYLFV